MSDNTNAVDTEQRRTADVIGIADGSIEAVTEIVNARCDAANAK